MMRIRTLSDLDTAVERLDGPQIVPPLPLSVGGVDPLGLRQLNFTMMDRCIPGLNNAAWRLRPYVVMAWAWWKMGRLAGQAGLHALAPLKARLFVDRIEILFQAGHLAAGNYDSLQGSEAIAARVLEKKGYDFSGEDWTDWHMRRRGQGSLLAPVSYGPSAKEGLGLGFLRAAGPLFVPVSEIMPAVRALDERLAPALRDPAFAALECGWVSLGKIKRWRSLWDMDDLSPQEIEVGRAALLRGGSASGRVDMIALVRKILQEADDPLLVDEIRTLAARSDQSWSTLPIARLWRALQARQLMRISLEGLLNWVLTQASDGPVSLQEMVGELHAALNVRRGATLDQWLAKDIRSSARIKATLSPVSLLDDIDGADQSDHPDLCAAGLRAAVAICREMGEEPDLFGGQPDRLPLERLSKRLKGAGQISMRDACELMISELLIGQHVYWAIGRSGDDTQRLRIVLDEGGWIALQGAGHANPTADRLDTLLRLAADCGLFLRDEDGAYLDAET
ncbi:hypothetical protein J2W40_002528 [Sphingobium xenophagum]|uniref:Uncharacterized protein n=2 Tax=Sphingobium xenophagum TaxID=121428 RepID=A0ABU1X3H6_SPHXE|nr:hypothetical protein [Sphingobium xenophagum]